MNEIVKFSILDEKVKFAIFDRMWTKMAWWSPFFHLSRSLALPLCNAYTVGLKKRMPELSECECI